MPHPLFRTAHAALHRGGNFVKGQFGLKPQADGVGLDIGQSLQSVIEPSGFFRLDCGG